MRKSLTVVVLLGVLAIATGLPLQAQNGMQRFQTPERATAVPLGTGIPTPTVLPPDSNPYGMSYGEWAGAWWRWAYSIPAALNPVADLSGEYAGLGQSGPVFFLAGTFGGSAERTINVPPNKALFFPILNQIWINIPELGDDPWSPEQEAFARALVSEIIDGVTLLECEIDGQPVDDIASYRVQTPPGKDYMVTFPDDNVWGLPAGTYGPSVDEGYYLMVAPLPPGAHTIHFKAEMTLPWDPFFFSVDVTYHLKTGSKGNVNPGILPPRSRAHGQSLGDWLEDYWRWYYTGGAAQTVPEQPGPAPIVYMPLPAGEQIAGSWTPDDPGYLKGELEVTLSADTSFVIPMFAWVAERYNTGQADDPSIPNDRIQSTVTGLDGKGLPVVTLDGQPILQNFWDYYVETRDFDPVVDYPEPSYYGSVAAIRFQGVGFLRTPLTPGTHVLKLLERMTITNEDLPGYEFEYNLGLIYDNTWIITVEE